jgi:predicted nucleotidyltransferase
MVLDVFFTKYINVNIFTTNVNKMTTILKSGIEKIIKVFYESKYEKIHLREISRLTGLEGQTIMRHLNILEKNKILKSNRVGNLKQFHLVNSQEVYSLLALFDVLKLNKLPLLRKNAIIKFVDRLSVLPVFMFVFGSTAKGTFREASDIDLFIVSNSKINTVFAQREVEALTSMKLNLFQISFKDFKKELKLKEDKVLMSALESGFPVLNHIFYYEVLNNERV